jgi:amidase
MDQAELAFAGIARQAELLRERQVSSAELVDLYLERIERIDPKLNAVTDVFADEARAAAASTGPAPTPIRRSPTPSTGGG